MAIGGRQSPTSKCPYVEMKKKDPNAHMCLEEDCCTCTTEHLRCIIGLLQKNLAAKEAKSDSKISSPCEPVPGSCEQVPGSCEQVPGSCEQVPGSCEQVPGSTCPSEKTGHDGDEKVAAQSGPQSNKNEEDEGVHEGDEVAATEGEADVWMESESEELVHKGGALKAASHVGVISEESTTCGGGDGGGILSGTGGGEDPSEDMCTLGGSEGKEVVLPVPHLPPSAPVAHTEGVGAHSSDQSALVQKLKEVRK